MPEIQIDQCWGTHLRHWLHLPTTFALLDQLTTDDAQFVSWHSGGCRVLAEGLMNALKRLRYPGATTLKIIASRQSPADHVVLKITTPANTDWYIDGDGAARKRTLLRRFAVRENRSETRLIDYSRALVDRYDIQCPPYKLGRLTTALCETIRQW